MKNLIKYEELIVIEKRLFELKILMPLFGILLYLTSLFLKFTTYPLTPILYISIVYLIFIYIIHHIFNKIKEKKLLLLILFISLFEILMANLIIYYTGGITSSLFILYILIILNFSAFRFPNYPILVSIICFLSYLFITLSQFYKFIPYINYYSSDFYSINNAFLYQRLFFIGIVLLIFSLYANKIILDLNNERRVLEFLREGSVLLTSYIGDREKFLTSIVKIAREVVEADSASIIEYRDDKYKFLAWDNLSDDMIKKVEETINLIKPFNLEEIREKKKIIKFDDVHKVPYWIKTENVRSYIGSPIVFKDTVIGILNIDSKKVNKFTDTDILNVETLSKIISIALEKDYLFNEISELNKQLENLSIKDPLTSLFNRRKLEEIVKYQINVFLRNKENFQLIMMDVDNFKKINDDLGHTEGDEFLIKLGKSLQNNIRRLDFVFRYGGDEFIIVIPNSPPPTVEVVMKRINKIFKEIFDNFIKSYNVGISYGYLSFNDFYNDIINKYPEKSHDDDFLYFQVLKYVDNLLYLSKRLKHID